MKSVAVVGAGAMGTQIALLCALYDFRVNLAELNDDTRATAAERIGDLAFRQVAKGRLTQAEVDTALDRIRVTAAVDNSDDVDLAIEAVTDNREIKRNVLAMLDSAFPSTTIVASNSSSFVPSSLTTWVNNRERFLNIHFFNPVLAMRCVEIIAAPETTPETLQRATVFVESLGKRPVVVKKEIPGFIANRILNAVRDEALRLYEGGYADIESIDVACRDALGYPMGPFELMDLTGIDIGYLTKTARFEETGDPADAPSSTVSMLIKKGTVGRKSGQGFYHYDAESRRGAPAL
jgi:3-hydroxybutyryl-CoA dehydrogenase